MIESLRFWLISTSIADQANYYNRALRWTNIHGSFGLHPSNFGKSSGRDPGKVKKNAEFIKIQFSLANGSISIPEIKE
jgi:hypothetical protein